MFHSGQTKRDALGRSVKIEDLTEKMWSDAKLIKMFSDLQKKMLSQLSGVSLKRMWIDLMEKIEDLNYCQAWSKFVSLSLYSSSQS